MQLKSQELGSSEWQGSGKTRGKKMKVTSIMLLKTHVVKMSDIGLSIMLLKNKIVIPLSPLY
jgi:hypothetical protein